MKTTRQINNENKRIWADLILLTRKVFVITNEYEYDVEDCGNYHAKVLCRSTKKGDIHEGTYIFPAQAIKNTALVMSFCDLYETASFGGEYGYERSFEIYVKNDTLHIIMKIKKIRY